MPASKIYKLKIADLSLTVTIDSSFTGRESHFESMSSAEKCGVHRHAVHELFFVGEKPLVVLSENAMLEYKNCLVCIPPLFAHNSIRNGDYRMLISCNGASSKANSFAQLVWKLLSTDKPTSVTISNAVLFYCNEIARMIDNPDTLSSEMAEAVLKLIFYNVYKCNSVIRKETAIQQNDSYLITIDNELNNYQNNINLQTVADALNLSTKQTSRIIRKNYKTTLSELVMTKRLGVACALLASSDMSIADIVEHINFQSESYFYAQFKKRYGCTPLKYRKLKQKGKLENVNTKS